MYTVKRDEYSSKEHHAQIFPKFKNKLRTSPISKKWQKFKNNLKTISLVLMKKSEFQLILQSKVRSQRPDKWHEKPLYLIRLQIHGVYKLIINYIGEFDKRPIIPDLVVFFCLFCTTLFHQYVVRKSKKKHNIFRYYNSQTSIIIIPDKEYDDNVCI